MDSCRSVERERAALLQALRQDGRALKFASPELRGYREVVLEAVRQDGRALQYASPELRGDLEVVLKAVRQDGQALDYASAESGGAGFSVRQNPFDTPLRVRVNWMRA